MDFPSLLLLVAGEPVFETGLLLAGPVDPVDVRRQLSRWVRSGRVLRLRRGLYALAPPYRKVEPHPFVVANRLAVGSYVSLESALAFHGLIPEWTVAVTSVTPGRPVRRRTPLGTFLYRHLGADLLHGYRRETVAPGQLADVALPEKALLDLVHLRPGADRPVFLEGMRLQGLDVLDLDRLARLAGRSGRSKLRRAATAVARLVEADVRGYRHL